MLTTPQVELIQRSFATAVSSRDDLVIHFYQSLFDKAPSVRGMFADDIAPQAKMLGSTLQFAVQKLDNIEALIEPLRALGAKHAGYGAKAAHYTVVADVLVSCLEEAVGPSWTQDHAKAWTDALNLIATTMLEGAAQSPVDEAPKPH